MMRLKFGTGFVVFAYVLSAFAPPQSPARIPSTAPSAGEEAAHRDSEKTNERPAGDPAKDMDVLLKQFVDALTVVRTQGAEEVAADKLIYEGAIPSMLRQLDPHTQFFEPVQFDQLKQMEQSEQKGFGSIVSVLPGQVIFLQTFPGTPSNKAGIQPGDELVAINNVAISSLEPQQIIQLLTEARQQSVTAYIRRQGSPRVLSFALTPTLMDSPSVDRAYLLRPSTGYIRIASWDLQTAKQLRDAIEKLSGDSLKALVIDLRNNPGGVVKAALDGAAMFLQPGQRILTAKGRTGEGETADVPKDAKPYKFKIAVLINEKTASASEILSGALQDHDRALIVGEPSYGKGLVQSVMALSNGAGLAITTAFYYTPSGRSIQRPLRNSALSETFRDEPGENRPTYKTDKGRSVTGGGGIQPDLKSAPEALTKLEEVLDASGAVTMFATQYLQAHPTLPESFDINPEIVDEFKVFLSSRRIQPSLAEWTQEREWVRNRLKAEIVTQARGVAQGDQVSSEHDPQIQAALRALDGNLLVADAR